MNELQFIIEVKLKLMAYSCQFMPLYQVHHYEGFLKTIYFPMLSKLFDIFIYLINEYILIFYILIHVRFESVHDL